MNRSFDYWTVSFKWGSRVIKLITKTFKIFFERFFVLVIYALVDYSAVSISSAIFKIFMKTFIFLFG